jgi:hypothetical protein
MPLTYCSHALASSRAGAGMGGCRRLCHKRLQPPTRVLFLRAALVRLAARVRAARTHLPPHGR